ncbi:GFA family protein [Yoonia sp. SS1-5]|uniref:GFA family protein n=1 Tax=Yoonia rhodophyticola TaxID=3137370 RepID=A0AAN0MBK3_9RHOB
MCGAVSVTVKTPGEQLHACHCDQCRNWTGSMLLSVSAPVDQVDLTGPVKTFRSSDWAERGWCDRCGTSLFYRTTDPEQAYYGLATGLFPNAGDLPLKLEYFIDNKPDGYAFSGDHQRMTKAETLAKFAPDEGDTQ